MDGHFFLIHHTRTTQLTDLKLTNKWLAAAGAGTALQNWSG